MTVSRQEYIDMYDLLSQTEEGTVSAGGIGQIDDIIVQDNTQLLQAYVEYIQLVSDLHFGLTNDRVEAMLTYVFGTNDMNREDAQGPNSTIGIQELSPLSATQSPPAPAFLSTTFHSTIGYFSQGMPLAYLLATVITGLGLLVGSFIHVSGPEQVVRNAVVPVVEPKAECVGRITGMADCKWAGGSRVSLGQKCELASGLLEITYDTGAKVILQGPVTYEVGSNGGFLSLGKLTGKLVKKAESGKRKAEENENLASLSTIHYPLSTPFAIRTPTATVTDLGTEFGVEVSQEGVTKTQVFVGSVKVAVKGDQNNGLTEQVVRAGNAVRIDVRGNQLTAIQASERRFVRSVSAHVATQRADDYAKLVLSMQPVAYYRMERPKDPEDKAQVFDSAPGGRHGILHLVNRFEEPWEPGRFGDGLRTVGAQPDTGGYVVVPDFPTSRTNQLSVSAWVYVCRYEGWLWRCIASDFGNSSTPELWQWQFIFRLCDPDGDLGIWVRQRDRREIVIQEGKANPLPTYQWQHVAFVADGSVLHLYRNGIEVGAKPAEGIFAAPLTRPLTIGCMDIRSPGAPELQPASFWRGNLDELAIFHRALSVREIRELCKGRRLKETTTALTRKEMP